MFYRLIVVFLIAHTLHAQDRSAEKLLEQGEAYYNAGNFSDALTSLDQAIALDPRQSRAFYVRASVKEHLKDLEGAHTDLSLYVNAHPEEMEGYWSRGVIRYRLNRFTEAKEDFMKVLQSPKGETQSIFFQRPVSGSGPVRAMTMQGNSQAPLYNYLALCEWKLGELSGALRWIDSAIAQQPKDPDLYVNRGMIKADLKDPKAKDDYAYALRLQPDHALALYNLGAGNTNSQSDVDYLEQAIASDSSMLYPYLERAYQRLQGGYYKGALEDYNQALKIETRDPEIWLNRGLTREKLNDYKGAYADYSEAIRLDEQFIKAFLNRGNVMVKLGKAASAVEDYTVAILLDPAYHNAYFNRAVAYGMLKRKAEACADLKKAAEGGMDIPEKMKTDLCPGN